ncbi:MAG TPA: MarR family winged helix-turn-helix transcriptional regulator [Mycobacteriales bacterium]
MDFEATPEEELWFGLLAVREQLVTALDARLRSEQDLPLSAFAVLVALSKHPGPMAVSTLAPLVGLVSRSQVSRLVDSLAARGLVERARGGPDARVHAVSATEAGLAAVTAGRRHADAVVREVVVDRLPDSDVRALRRAFARLTGYDTPR